MSKGTDQIRRKTTQATKNDPPPFDAAMRGKRQIQFSSREFSLMEYLVRNCDAVLSRTQICERVWGYPYDGISKVVDVYVNYLRNKLEENGEPRLIHTVRGHGYVFRAESEE